MKKNTPPNLNYAWAHRIFADLAGLGVNGIFVAPGSRSTPLALAAAEQKNATVTVHYDERGLGFMALGHARATGRPAVVITTSGTAVANLLPAVCEAAMDEIPLIVLTADRPPELRDTGANQAMDHVKIFGSYVRWGFDLPCPDVAISPAALSGTIGQAYAMSMGVPPGPVHLNAMFREPLAPVPANDGSAAWWRRTRSGPAPVYRPSALPDLGPARAVIAAAQRGVIVAGAARNQRESEAMLACAKRLGWPVLPDIRSGLRLGAGRGGLIRMADHVLLSDAVAKAMAPDVILHLGGRITSKRIMRFAADGKATIVHVSPSPVRLDPDHRVSAHIVADITADALPLRTQTPAAWRRQWQAHNDRVVAAWQLLETGQIGLSEPALAASVARLLPSNHALYLAASMPVRDMDMYALGGPDDARVVANRGVSGIDGTIASAVGFGIGTGRPVTLIIGDLAFLHDLNSLARVRDCPVPLIIVLIQNDGGGIFSFLPVAGTTPQFERCLSTPHGLPDFRDAAALYELDYAAPATMEEFRQRYMEACRDGQRIVLEVRTDRAENLLDHRAIQAHIAPKGANAG